MSGGRKKDLNDRAFGESIASLPEMRALKLEAARKLASGEDRASVFDQLLEGIQNTAGETERLLGFDRTIAEWILGWAETGEPGALELGLRGRSWPASWTGQDGETVTVVLAVAGPTSDPEEVAEDFLRLCRKELPAECFKQKLHPERDARWFRLHKEGTSYREIAELVLREDGFDLRCANEEDWKQELDAWTGRITVACLRWQEHLTQMADSV